MGLPRFHHPGAPISLNAGAQLKFWCVCQKAKCFFGKQIFGIMLLFGKQQLGNRFFGNMLFGKILTHCIPVKRENVKVVK